MHPHHLIPRDVYMKNDIPVAGCAHQAGTVRFGNDPATSVLDTDCKAHELDNLYVVDTSFFPSIGAVNPALTAMANALRVGDHLLDPARLSPDRDSMATRSRELAVVNAAGLVQGITLVTFPAASSILTSPDGVRPVQLAVRRDVPASGGDGHRRLAARLAAGLAFTAKRVLLLGLGANLVSMALLLISATVKDDESVAYPLLLLATGFLGAGFRADRPVAEHLRGGVPPGRGGPGRPGAQRLAGARHRAGAGVRGVFVGLGFWWGLPLLSASAAGGSAGRRSPAAAGGAVRTRPGAAQAATPSGGIPPGSGCSRASPCCTGCARR